MTGKELLEEFLVDVGVRKSSLDIPTLLGVIDILMDTLDIFSFEHDVSCATRTPDQDFYGCNCQVSVVKEMYEDLKEVLDCDINH